MTLLLKLITNRRLCFLPKDLQDTMISKPHAEELIISMKKKIEIFLNINKIKKIISDFEEYLSKTVFL